MKISIIVPVGNMDEWKICEASLRMSISVTKGAAEAEVLPCYDIEHKGVYVARNEGLSRATGEWIAWVDCDDVVEPEWFGEIVVAIKSHAEEEIDVIQFDATEVKDRSIRSLPYGRTGYVSGEDFSRELLRNDGMPAWLWTRVFRRETLLGVSFVGRDKEDYQMFLQILPRIRGVWSIGKPLYCYMRHGHGLSNYVQPIDYFAIGHGFETQIAALPKRWLHDARIGLALTMADVACHSKDENGSRYWVRKFLLTVCLDWYVPIRLKIKALLASL